MQAGALIGHRPFLCNCTSSLETGNVFCVNGLRVILMKESCNYLFDFRCNYLYISVL